MADVLPFPSAGELDWCAFRDKIEEILIGEAAEPARVGYVLRRLDGLNPETRYYDDNIEMAEERANVLIDLTRAFSEIYTLAHGAG